MKQLFLKLTALIIIIICSACTPIYPMELGMGYKLDYDSNSELYVGDPKNTIIVSGHVVEINFDSKYIIVKQKPREYILRDSITKSTNITQEEKIFRESTLRRYWIIDKGLPQIYDLKTWRYSNVYGSLSKEEYLSKRKDLGIPNELKLIDTSEYVKIIKSKR